MLRIDANTRAICYAVVGKWDPTFQVAWFMSQVDAQDFLNVMSVGDKYEIVEVRK